MISFIWPAKPIYRNRKPWFPGAGGEGSGWLRGEWGSIWGNEAATYFDGDGGYMPMHLLKLMELKREKITYVEYTLIQKF